MEENILSIIPLECLMYIINYIDNIHDILSLIWTCSSIRSTCLSYLDVTLNDNVKVDIRFLSLFTRLRSKNVKVDSFFKVDIGLIERFDTVTFISTRCFNYFLGSYPIFPLLRMKCGDMDITLKKNGIEIYNIHRPNNSLYTKEPIDNIIKLYHRSGYSIDTISFDSYPYSEHYIIKSIVNCIKPNTIIIPSFPREGLMYDEIMEMNDEDYIVKEADMIDSRENYITGILSFIRLMDTSFTWDLILTKQSKLCVIDLISNNIGKYINMGFNSPQYLKVYVTEKESVTLRNSINKIYLHDKEEEYSNSQESINILLIPI